MLLRTRRAVIAAAASQGCRRSIVLPQLFWVPLCHHGSSVLRRSGHWSPNTLLGPSAATSRQLRTQDASGLWRLRQQSPPPAFKHGRRYQHLLLLLPLPLAQRNLFRSNISQRTQAYIIMERRMKQLQRNSKLSPRKPRKRSRTVGDFMRPVVRHSGASRTQDVSNGDALHHSITPTSGTAAATTFAGDHLAATVMMAGRKKAKTGDFDQVGKDNNDKIKMLEERVKLLEQNSVLKERIKALERQLEGKSANACTHCQRTGSSGPARTVSLSSLSSAAAGHSRLPLRQRNTTGASLVTPSPKYVGGVALVRSPSIRRHQFTNASRPSGIGRAGSRTSAQQKKGLKDTLSFLSELPGNSIVCWTDGACLGQPGPAGSAAIAIFQGKETCWEHMVRQCHRCKEVEHPEDPFPLSFSVFHVQSRHFKHATNNIAELTAIQMAIEMVYDYITVDDVCGTSQCKRQDLKVGSNHPKVPVTILTDSRYAQGMLQFNWKATKNIELVRDAKRILGKLKALDRVERVSIEWVPGHCGLGGNVRADEMAGNSAKSGESIDLFCSKEVDDDDDDDGEVCDLT